MKDALKARAYRCDGERNVWWLEVVDRSNEKWWLAANVYCATAKPKALGPEWVRITNRQRWSA
ncbi:hypothetical protein [Novosphingobium sp.]|uniref:hypothetical protein n=1 Tax=Novosphingobium sp. TaxID=1874826 RepID=UPI003D6D0273